MRGIDQAAGCAGCGACSARSADDCGSRFLAMTAALVDFVERLGGPGPRASGPPPSLVVRAGEDRDRLAAYGALRRQAFVERHGLFERDDGDEHDGAAHTIVLVAVAAAGGGGAVDPARTPAA